MYEITLDGQTLWYPGNVDYCVTEAVLHGELNASGYMDLTVPKTNPLYSKIESGVNIIKLFKNNKENWTGVVQDVTIDFSGNKILYVVGVLSYLIRTVQPQHNFLAMVGTDTPTITYYSTKRKIINYLLARHNEQIENGKKFFVGTIDASIGDEYYELNMDFQYTLDVLKQIAGETGYYRIRTRDDGNYFLDFVTIENYGKKSGQEIRFAKNLLEYKNKVSGVDICTAILPLGERLENSEVEGMDAYLRINSVNGGVDYISDSVAVAKYGLIKKFVKFEGVKDASQLLAKAKAYLAEYKTGYLDFTLTAIDMSQLDTSIDNYDVGDYVHCICESLDTDVWLPVQSKDTDLLNLSNNRINLSKMPRLNTLTKATVQLNTDPPTENSMLEQANEYADQAADEAYDEAVKDANGYTHQQIVAVEGKFDNLIATKASIQDLQTVNLAVSGKASINDLNALSLTVSGKANITDLNATNAKIANIESSYVKTNELSTKLASIAWNGLTVRTPSGNKSFSYTTGYMLTSLYSSNHNLKDSTGKPCTGVVYLSARQVGFLTSY